MYKKIIISLLISFFVFPLSSKALSLSYSASSIRDQNNKKNYSPTNWNYFDSLTNVSWNKNTQYELYWNYSKQSNQDKIINGIVSFSIIIPDFNEEYYFDMAEYAVGENKYGTQYFCSSRHQNGTCQTYQASQEWSELIYEHVPSSMTKLNLTTPFLILYVYDGSRNYPCNVSQVRGSNIVNASCSNITLNNNNWAIIVIGRGWVRQGTIGINSVTYSNDPLHDISVNTNDTNQRLDEINNTQKETNKKMDELNNNLTSDDIGDNDYGQLSGLLPPGPLDSLLSIPITTMNTLINYFSNDSCPNIFIDLPFTSSSFQFPCFRSIFQSLGFWSFYNSFIGSLASGLLLYFYLSHFSDRVQKMLLLDAKFVNKWGGV